METTIWKVGKYYKEGNTIIRCTDPSPEWSVNSFEGIIIESIDKGEVGYCGEWYKNNFTEIDYSGPDANNGWTKLISEEDLPTKEGIYVVGFMNGFGRFNEFENRMNLERLVYNYQHNKITHYKPYISKPPKY